MNAAYLAAAVESADDAIVTKDLNGLIQSWNAGAQRLFGYTPDEAVGQPITMLIPLDRISEETEILRRIREGERIDHYETVRLHKSGERIRVSVSISPIKDAHGKVIGASKIARRLTTSRASSGLAGVTLDLLPIAFYACDRDGRITRYNRHAAELWGREPRLGNDERFCGSYRLYRADGTHLPHAETPMARAIATGVPIRNSELVIERPDGSRITVLVNIAPLYDERDRLVETINCFQDITERKQLEQKLRLENGLRRAIGDAIDEGIIAVDTNGRITYVNHAFCAMTGWQEAELLGCDPPFRFWPEDKRAAIEAEFRAVLRGDVPDGRSRELQFVRRDGHSFEVTITPSPLTDRNGTVIGLVASIADVTEQRKAEASVAHLAAIVESSSDAIISKDLNGVIKSWNKGAENIFGYRPEEIVGRSVLILIPPERHDEEPRILERLRRGERVDHYETVRVRKDGRRLDISLTISPIRDARGRIVGASKIARDISEHKRAEQELLKAQRIESLGVLAGGIAHDFNNILTALFGNVQFARLLADGRDDVISALTQAENAFNRARDLTQQLLTFSRGGAPVRQSASLAELLRDNVGFVLHGSNVAARFEIGAELWPVHVDVGQLSQAINNLVLNAKEAMPSGGTVRVCARNRYVDEDATRLGVAPGRYVELRIEDSGCGIKAEDLSHIFDPYFSTKRGGRGLGLATTYSVVKRHGGTVRVDSMPGHGTVFTMLLPAADEQVPGKASRPDVARGAGRLLLMDDEEDVRKVGAALLTHLGYQVDVAADGAEAVNQFNSARERRVPYDIAILDLTVPGRMSGMECLRHLREIEPNVKVLVSTGYSNDPVLAKYRAHGFAGIVPKPYRIDDLSQVIATTLGERSTPPIEPRTPNRPA